MQALIVDVDIDDKYDRLLQQCPAIDISCAIQPLSADVLGKQFYENLSQLGKEVDYVVIALGDDALNKQAALELQRYYLRMTGNSPVIAVFSRFESYNNGKLFCFGLYNGVYNEATIIREEADMAARELNSGYDRDKQKQGRNELIQWHELDWLSQESKRSQVDFIPVLIKLAGFTEEQLINFKNIHIDKSELVTETIIANLNLDSSLAARLAETEHLRWNAFHVIMGYGPMGIEEMRRRYEKYAGQKEYLPLCRKDTNLRLHLCLVPWSQLDDYCAAYHEIDAEYKDFKRLDYDIIKWISAYLKLNKSER
jgi:hypothetical protein